MRRPNTFLDSPVPLAFAHRGGVAYPPNAGIENSLAAFGNAVDLGYRYVETDARASADGVVYAFHDARLDRVTDRTGALAELRAEQIDEARIGGREPIPRLSELLARFEDLRVNIDVKDMASIEPTVAAIRRAGAEDRVCLASFSHRRLREVRRLAPRLATSASPPEVARVVAHPWHVLRRVRGLGACCVQVPVRSGPLRVVTRRFVDSAHDLGLQVHVWTVDDPEEIGHLLDLGVDGIMTDRIDVLRDVLVDRDQWTGRTQG
ncbi:glycerophosphoryl diester phosphodiesterase [Mumia flava]|uniref:Glycerophosphoryl diester phosphodiesterase n=1 Tax=Mumia flava TaxID=1348852 RepID=A0A0B2B8J1_9ACTN|nr:glycerophosphodiester phosphodiesterase [Mumia flava]PJJ53474.1 glycerophosphoryl diester phosphodiesterase [Mumia flava]